MKKERLMELAGMQLNEDQFKYLKELGKLTGRSSGFVRLEKELRKAYVNPKTIHKVIDALSDAYNQAEDKLDPLTESSASEPMYERAVAEIAKYIAANAKAKYGQNPDKMSDFMMNKAVDEVEAVLKRMKNDVTSKVKELVE